MQRGWWGNSRLIEKFSRLINKSPTPCRRNIEAIKSMLMIPEKLRQIVAEIEFRIFLVGLGTEVEG